eukprot:gnl/Spiro4/24747_TR12298_c0_g1_i1.p1 gnl/Spiro4/24747_TR12298_c0_g1~~gnl/Spiro4/24747_TR12298_c0_g1_i1.p1  ORF type:complete len:545 (+),score=143.09 gnl/Spiro4/24747_TR12298_c0_g1_i1:81-1637(+)
MAGIDSTVPVISVPQLSTVARVMADVPMPVADPLPHSRLFNSNGSYACDNIKEHFVREGRLDINDAIQIVQRAAEILRGEKNLLRINDQVTVVGDIHGQFYDLVKVFELGGSVVNEQTQFLFLGDYVDRGVFSTEVCLFLFALKITYPNNYFLIRGNHECRHLTAYFNFKEECLKKYNLELYEEFMDCFDTLPLAALLNNKFLCMHGGLSPEISTLNDIENIVRFMEPPLSGPMCDLLWSDPHTEVEVYEDPDQPDFQHNNVRGCSYFYSFNAVQRFLDRNNLLSIIRAHEAQFEGYQMLKKIDSTEFPSVITVFSAPNYCGTYGNKGAVLRFQNNLLNIRQFSCSAAPYWLPNFQNVFQWSIPFVAEKVTEMLQAILSLEESPEEKAARKLAMRAAGAAGTAVNTNTPPAPASPIGKSASLGERAGQMKKKIVAVGKLIGMLRTLQTERETIQILKQQYGDNKLPMGLLSAGPQALRVEFNTFMNAKKTYESQEMRPPGAPPLSRSASRDLLASKKK